MTIHDNKARSVETRSEAAGWAVPVALVAAALIIGGMFYFNSGDSRTTTASNSIPAQSSPVPPGAPVPGPTTTAPAPNR